jgi:hypothetical protein
MAILANHLRLELRPDKSLYRKVKSAPAIKTYQAAHGRWGSIEGQTLLLPPIQAGGPKAKHIEERRPVDALAAEKAVKTVTIIQR